MAKTTKQEIFETGLQLFLQQGYHAVTVQQICAACGVSKGSFYHHFHSKEELLLHFFYYRHPEPPQEMPDSGPCFAPLLALYQDYNRDLKRLGKGLVRCLLQTDLDHGNQLFDGYLQQDSPYLARLRAYGTALIARGQRQGEFRPGDPLALLQLATMGTIAVVMRWCASAQDWDMDPALARVMALALGCG